MNPLHLLWIVPLAMVWGWIAANLVLILRGRLPSTELENPSAGHDAVTKEYVDGGKP